MKISIIIPCYNSYKFMNNCLSALENQTKKFFEVVIIDDCSTDNSYEELLKYQTDTSLDIKILRLNKNSGPGVARNEGIKKAKGDYVIFCDSDDWYDKNTVEILINKIEKKNMDIILYDYNKIIKNKKVKANSLEKLNIISSKEEIIANAEQSLWCMCIKRSLFDSLEIPSLYNGEDVAIVPILLSKAKRIYILQETLYNYYFRENSSSNKVSIRIPNQLLEAFNYIEKNLVDVDIEVKEFLGIKIVLYGVVLNLLKLKEIHKAKDIILNFEKKYSNWYKNKYLKNLSKIKKGYLYCIKMNFIGLNLIFAKLHERILNFKEGR